MDIILNGIKYRFVKDRIHSSIVIYTDGTSYLRVGEPEEIKQQLELHKKLVSYGFPVAELISDGPFEDKYYYLEKSVGKTLLGDIFWEDCKSNKIVSEQHFEDFLNLSKKIAQAQLSTAKPEHDMEDFFTGIHTNYLLEELPQLKDKIFQAFEKIKKCVSIMPNVLTHGDLNPYNLFKDHVIDFGSCFNAPAGYDIVGNFYHTYNFPKSGEYEMMRRYEFSKEQADRYFIELDAVYTDAGLPKLSDFLEDFIFAKIIWSSTRIHRFPKVQQWRYDRFEKTLDDYLNDRPILLSIMNE